VPAFLAYLPRLLEAWKADGVEVVLYQAGADPHVDDPIGCRFLTTEELYQRDRAVFLACARLDLPIAWNLAGGYQEDTTRSWPESIRPVLDIHDNTMRACVEAFIS
jgi:acetoin utilization deacetylase AcuC-like enzyme